MTDQSIAGVGAGEQVDPEALLPFGVDQAGVGAALHTWVASRWFAPATFKQNNSVESLEGAYVPHWSFSARTVSGYRGERGNYYYVTESSTQTVNGYTQTSSRQVRKTQWRSASGTTARDFSDVLVAATGQVTVDRLENLGPWPLAHVVPYQPDYLTGYRTLQCETGSESGLLIAKSRMATVIVGDCRRDIGGDEQRVRSLDTRYSNVTYKLLLLPVWIVCYLHAGKTYQVLVNGTTGKVVGERPYDKARIAMVAIGALVAIMSLILLLPYLTNIV